MFNKLFKNSAILVTIFTAFCYIVGIVSHQGYLSEFGVTAKIFPLTFHETVLKGATTIIAMFWDFRWYIIFSILGFYLLLFLDSIYGPFFKSEAEENEKQAKRRQSSNEKKQINETIDTLIENVKWYGSLLSVFLIYAIILVAILSLTVVISYNYGEKTANKFKTDFKSQVINKENRNARMVKFSWDGSLTKGAIVSSSSNYILIYTEKLKAIVLNNNELKHIQIPD